METLRNQIIDQIFKLLAPLRSLYKEEIDKVTNDLLNNNTKSLEEFISKYYNNVANTKEFADLVTSLVNSNLIDSSFLEQIISPKESIKQTSVRPLNVRIETLNSIKKNRDLSKLDLTKFPVSLMEKQEIVENNEITNKEVVTKVQEEVTPVEIEPDYNTIPDIHLPFDSDTESEIPDFNTYNKELNDGTTFDLPNTNNNLEIPAIEISKPKDLEVQTPDIISKEEIFESIKPEDNQKPIEEKAQDTTIEDNLKNTTQFGQILQFPYENAIPTPSEIPSFPVETNQDMINQNATPAINTNPVEPVVTTPVEVPKEDISLPNTDIMNQDATPNVMPDFATNHVEPEVPHQDNYVNIEPTYQENINLDTMNNQDTTPDIMPTTDPVEPELPIQTEFSKEETSLPSQDITPNIMPDFVTNHIEPEVPPQDNYVSIEPTYQENINLDTMNQDNTLEVMPNFEINQEEPELPSIPLPDDMIKNEVSPTPQKSEEELRQEIENKVREAVREELKQEISELTNKTKEELKQEISEMATKTKEEVKQELTEKIRQEEKNNILRIQNDYMNNANEFINSLNNKDEEEIYTSLRLLNDLRYMSHCIAHLSPETLERFYLYIERKLNSPEKEFMDTIIEKRIKEILPPNISYNLELEATNNHEVFRKTA